MFEMEFKLSLIRSKVLCLGISEPTKRSAAQSASYTLRNRQGKQTHVKQSEKNISVKRNL